MHSFQEMLKAVKRFSKRTVKQLRQFCKQAGIRGYSKLRKHQIIKLLVFGGF